MRGLAAHTRKPVRRLRARVQTLALVIVILCPRIICADDGDFGSALQIGIGGAYTGAIGDPAAIWLNPAAPSLAHPFLALNLSSRRLFNLKALEENAGSGQLTIAGQVTVAGGFSLFGQSGLYQDMRAVAGLSLAIKKDWAVGASLGYRRVEFGNGTQAFSGATIDLGAASSPTASVVVGAAVRRISLDRLYQAGDQRELFEVSAAWSAPPDITLAGIWSKESGESSRFGLGQRLLLARDFLYTTRIEFLSGLRFDPVRYSLGGHIVVGGGWIDYAYQSHPDLGGTHTVAFTWWFPPP